MKRAKRWRTGLLRRCRIAALLRRTRRDTPADLLLTYTPADTPVCVIGRVADVDRSVERAGLGVRAERLLLRLHGLCLPRAVGRLLPDRSRHRAGLLRPGPGARFTGGPCQQGGAVEAHLLLRVHGLRHHGAVGRLLPDRRRRRAGLLQPGPGARLVGRAAQPGAVAAVAAALFSPPAAIAAVAAVAARGAGCAALRRRAARFVQAALPRCGAAPAAANQDLGRQASRAAADERLVAEHRAGRGGQTRRGIDLPDAPRRQDPPRRAARMLAYRRGEPSLM